MIKVFIADDHQMILEAWSTVLKEHLKFELVGKAKSATEVITFLQHHKVDLLVTDIDMGNKKNEGLSMIADLKRTFTNLDILVVSMHDEIAYIQDAIELGVNGYILKSNSTKEMLLAMHRISDGDTYFSHEAMDKVYGKMKSKNEYKRIHLTGREKKVLPLICDGYSSKEIGLLLNISINTVNTYRKQLHSKFEVNKLSTLIKKAHQLGYHKSL